MTDRERGFQQAWSDAMSDGYMPWWTLRHYSAEFQAGYRTGQQEIEASVDAAAQERIFDPIHD